MALRSARGSVGGKRRKRLGIRRIGGELHRRKLRHGGRADGSNCAGEMERQFPLKMLKSFLQQQCFLLFFFFCFFFLLCLLLPFSSSTSITSSTSTSSWRGSLPGHGYFKARMVERCRCVSDLAIQLQGREWGWSRRPARHNRVTGSYPKSWS